MTHTRVHSASPKKRLYCSVLSQFIKKKTSRALFDPQLPREARDEASTAVQPLQQARCSLSAPVLFSIMDGLPSEILSQIVELVPTRARLIALRGCSRSFRQAVHRAASTHDSLRTVHLTASEAQVREGGPCDPRQSGRALEALARVFGAGCRTLYAMGESAQRWLRFALLSSRARRAACDASYFITPPSPPISSWICAARVRCSRTSQRLGACRTYMSRTSPSMNMQQR